MARLFKNKIIEERIQKLKIPDFERKLDLIKSWHESYKNGELQNKTETQCEQAFNQDIFVNVLGYALFPKDIYTIQPKDNVESGGGQLPDATLGYFNNRKKRVIAVVEIKDVNTNLDKAQYREGSLSPIQQAFKYKPQFKECGFVIATNFFEIRLFRDNQLDYEKFTLSELVNPEKDYFNLKKFYFLLCSTNFISETGQTETEKLLSVIRIEQEKITDKFYKQYKQLREDLIRDIVENNEQIKLTDFYIKIVEKAQKIVDRIVLICFFEDAGLLPEGKLNEVVEYAQKGALNEPIWDTLKKFFKAVDEGSDRLGVPNGYNGELFKYDDGLEKIKISDSICKRFVNLTNFDFEEDLSVNILGHIFEQSVTDLEQLKYSQNTEVTLDTKEIKRKQEGIFYTPEYIVDYIVKSSLNKIFESKEAEILNKHNIDNKRLKEPGYNKKIEQAYTEYSKFLRNIKILDPACGSGAFLVKVFDYLLSEHKRIFRIVNQAKGIKDGAALFSEDDLIKPILENNIFGVDLNPESVEITKLSLWLKSAKKGQKLTTLKNNIKCGNSLFSDSKIVGDAAFNWSKEFETIFEQGGFDVVVGNPPYGVKFSKEEKKYLSEFDPLVPDYEIYIYFISKGLSLLKDKGILGYIFPNTFLSTQFGIKYRESFLKNNSIISLTDLSTDQTFQDASVRTCILLATPKLSKTETELSSYSKSLGAIDKVKNINIEQLKNFVSNWLTLFTVDEELTSVLKKVRDKKFKISDYFEVSQGLIPYDKYRGHDVETIKNRIWHSNEKKDETYKAELEGGDVKRYSVHWNGATWISYGKWLAAPRDPKFFTQPRVLVREIVENSLFCAYTTDEYYNTPSIINVIKKDDEKFSLKVLTAILNSTLIGLYHYNTSPKAKKGLFPKILVSDVRSIPIPSYDDLKEKTYDIETIVDKLQQTNKDFYDLQWKTKELLRHSLALEKLPRKADYLYNLSFDEFIALTKAKLAVDKKYELLDFFTKQKEGLLILIKQINSLDQELNMIVNDIYALTSEEKIKVNSFKKNL